MYETRDPSLSSAWNFGPVSHDECPVSELMDLFCTEWGGNSAWEHVIPQNAPFESSVLRLSIDKAIHQLQWRPRWSLLDAVRRTVGWYQDYYLREAESMQEYCLQEIEAYIGALA